MVYRIFKSKKKEARIMEKKEFVSSDVWLSAGLSLILNIPPELRVIENNKVLFVFPGDDSTYRAISDFNNGLLFQYSETVKKLRVAMFQRRAGER